LLENSELKKKKHETFYNIAYSISALHKLLLVQ